MADIATGLPLAALLAGACRLHGERPFLVHLSVDGTRREYSYAAFTARCHQAARAFQRLGIGAGDAVLLQLGNRPETLVTLFGLLQLGAIAVPQGIEVPPRELSRVYADSGARWAVVADHRVDDHRSLREELGVKGGGLVERLDELCARESADAPAVAALPSDAIAELLYTSGTTAAPKGVQITHANLVFAGHYGVWQTSLRSDDRLFTTMPACHSNFQLAALLPVLVAGATLVMIERYSATRFWAQVREERATVAQLIAMMVRTLLLQPPSPEDGRHSLRDALYFMPISSQEKTAFEHRFRLPLLNSYGSTESIGWALTDPPTGERRWPSVGRPGLGYQVAIVDDSGQELPPGEQGEIRIKGVRGLSLMAGYHNDPRATAAALSSDGWLRTHDVGFRDADGWFYFVDRDAGLIKRAGENISTAEVECVLTAHPDIEEAAVIGVPDPVRDQAVKAYVRVRAGAGLTAADVIAHSRVLLAPHKVPGSVEFVHDFPRNHSMKIEKRLLSQSTRVPRGLPERT